MDSDPFQNFQSQAQNQQLQQPPPTNPGLLRYRSAPSSYFNNLLEIRELDRDLLEEFLAQPSSPGAEGGTLGGLVSGNLRSRDKSRGRQPELPGQEEKSKADVFQLQPKQEEEPQLSSYSASASPNYYPSSSHPMLPNQSLDYRAVSSVGAGAGLLRQSSSPPGLFLNNPNIMEGFSTFGGMGSFGMSPREESYSPTTRFGNPINYLSAGQPSSSEQMSPIAEIRGKNVEKGFHCSEGGGFDEGHGNNYDAGFPLGVWDDLSLTVLDTEGRRGPSTILARHLSLPTTSSETERLLQIQDLVPCKIRAKRGFATHPRSIAERVRRTKISERIRKLQDLVPNMDKQTNTSDVLDLAVDYIKELQDQVKVLSDTKSKCLCLNRQM